MSIMILTNQGDANMNTFNIRVDGNRTTCTMPSYLVALLWGAGVDDVAGVLQEQLDDSEAWDWSGQWSDTVSGRLQAIAMRYVADGSARDWAAVHVHGVDALLPPRDVGESHSPDLGRAAPGAGRQASPGGRH